MSDSLELFHDAVALEEIYDAASGDYRVPWPASAWTQLTGLKMSPERWQRMIVDPSADEMDAGIAMAIVDTGVLSHHPFLRGRLAAVEDFTGEGADDVDGHGTNLALLTALDTPWMPIISAKVVAQAPVPYEEQIARVAQAIDWAVAQKPRVLQLAIGSREECGPREEPFCAAVKRALDAEIFVVVIRQAKCPGQCDARAHLVGPEQQPVPGSPRGYEYMSTQSDFIADLLAGHIAARELGMQPPAPRPGMGFRRS